MSFAVTTLRQGVDVDTGFELSTLARAVVERQPLRAGMTAELQFEAVSAVRNVTVANGEEVKVLQFEPQHEHVDDFIGALMRKMHRAMGVPA